MIRPLEEQNIDRVYPHHYGQFIITIFHIMLFVLVADKRAELKKLNRSILICFLELLDILINDPSSSEVIQSSKLCSLYVLSF